MNKDRPASAETGQFPTAKRRAAILVLIVLALVLAASSDILHTWLVGLLGKMEPIIRHRPVLGVAVFILFAAASAMLAFVSSAVIVPVGVYVWGNAVSMLLLWTGWIIGGVCSYTLSRYLGRRAVKAISSGAALARYEKFISQRAPFALVMLFQLAMPSEVPGYLLGLVRYRFWKYLIILALSELPFAVATVYMGAGFLEQRMYLLILVGGAVAAFSGSALYALHRRLRGVRTSQMRSSRNSE
jgi:uncharacterized membrane protein YdjX (TVP38/TMEM64 family)